MKATNSCQKILKDTNKGQIIYESRTHFPTGS